MRADDVILAARAALLADAPLVALLGGAHIYRMGAERPQQVPSIEWVMVSDTYRENTESILTQWDVWAEGYAAAMAIEARLRARFHGNLPQTMGTVLVWAQYQDSRDHVDPVKGVAHRSIDFSFETYKEV